MTVTAKSQNIKQKKKPVLPVKLSKSDTLKSNHDYHEMIAQAAYYKAEQRGFVPGFEQEDWLAAEYEIYSMLDLH